MIVVLLTAFAQDALGPAEFVKVRSTTLPDGLQVVAVEQPAASLVTLAVAIDGGRGDEPEPGLARAAGETWFQTDASPVSTVEQRYDRLGALTEVAVDADTTLFTTRVKPDRLPGALALEWKRFTGPLAGVDEIAPVTPKAARDAYLARHLDDVYQALFPEEHPYRDAWKPGSGRPPFYLASSWVLDSWRPETSTLVIAGPIDADTLLCELHPSGCQVAPAAVVEAPLVLPEPTITVKSKAARRREVGPLARGVDPTLLLAWSMPGSDTIGAALPALIHDRVEEELGAVVRGVRCAVRVGRAASTLICELPVDQDMAALDRELRKGWSTKKLAKDVELWRTRRMNGLLGSSAEPSFPQRLALHLREGGDPGPYAGALEDLAFDESAVEALLDGAVAYRSAVWVRLEP